MAVTFYLIVSHSLKESQPRDQIKCISCWPTSGLWALHRSQHQTTKQFKLSKIFLKAFHGPRKHLKSHVSSAFWDHIHASLSLSFWTSNNLLTSIMLRGNVLFCLWHKMCVCKSLEVIFFIEIAPLCNIFLTSLLYKQLVCLHMWVVKVSGRF